jgi:sec-independent protein translocase protein TatC
MPEIEKEKLRSMSLGDHLEELRTRLILTFAGLLIGVIVCLFFGKFFINILTIPFDKAIGTKDVARQLQTIKPAEGKAIGTEDVVRHLQTIKPAEGFLVYVKVCLFFGLLVSSPWVFWQIWSFVSSGLYKHEKNFVHAVVPASSILFITGSLFFLFAIAPLAMSFFIRINEKLSIASNWTIQNYMDLVLSLTLVFGIAFQLPIAIIFAERMGLVSVPALQKGRKFVILALVIIAAMATPPDVISQIALATPLYILFESSILICKFLRKRKE